MHAGWLRLQSHTHCILNSYFYYSATMVPRMHLTVTLYVQCLCRYVMSPIFWTFFRTWELHLSLQVPVLWNKSIKSNTAELKFSVLLILWISQYYHFYLPINMANFPGDRYFHLYFTSFILVEKKILEYRICVH